MGWLHLALFGVVLPWLATRSALALPAHAQRPRKGHFRSVIVVQGVALLISLRVAAVEGIALVPATVPPPLAVGLGAVMVAGGPCSCVQVPVAGATGALPSRLVPELVLHSS